MRPFQSAWSRGWIRPWRSPSQPRRHPVSEEQKWPDVLWIVRHGQSAGNVAREAAEAAGKPIIDLAVRDIDVPLSALGKRQAQALGCWFGQMPEEQKPNVVLTSPYVRSR